MSEPKEALRLVKLQFSIANDEPLLMLKIPPEPFFELIELTSIPVICIAKFGESEQISPPSTDEIFANIIAELNTRIPGLSPLMNIAPPFNVDDESIILI